MESALRPREIQARVRAGESLDEVALAAGVPPERVEVYAAPVFAERAYVAQQAQEAPVRRRGENSSTRTLIAAVTERLTSRGIERGDVEWDAWKLEGRRWNVQADFVSDEAERRATFIYDQSARFSVATNEDAQWLISDEPPADPLLTKHDPDAEPTLDLDDELAIVRAVDVERFAFDDAGETVDAYTPGDLEEVDGVYDIVPPSSDMDLLYDMLSSFNEDSVEIYRGLTTPVVVDEPEAPAQWTHGDDSTPVSDTTSADHEGAAPADSAERGLPRPPSSPPPSAAAERKPTRSSRSAKPKTPKPEAAVPTVPEPPVQPPLSAQSAPHSAQSASSASVSPEQETPAPPEPKKPSQRRSRKRASVPSWDEIMFGTPTPPKDAN